MKIPRQLPQFNIRRGLLIAASRQQAVFYEAFRGEMNEIGGFEIEKPRYSDDEGRFATRTETPGNLGAGSVKEMDDKEIKRIFFNQFEEKLADIKEEVKERADDVYVFCPDYSITELINELPEELKKKLTLEIEGNFVKDHPVRLLEEIDKVLTEKIKKIRNKPRSAEEEKILQIAEQASKKGRKT